MPSTIAIA
jgi:hypothetical protein